MVIVKGKTYKSLYAYNTKQDIDGAMYTYQQRAWIEDALGEIWFNQHFLKHWRISPTNNFIGLALFP